MLKCSLGVRGTLLVIQGNFDFNIQVLVEVLNLDAFKAFICLHLKRWPYIWLILYINKEGEVVGLMAHPLHLLIITQRLKDFKSNIMHEDVY